jgi:hypothetical protein
MNPTITINSVSEAVRTGDSTLRDGARAKSYATGGDVAITTLLEGSQAVIVACTIGHNIYITHSPLRGGAIIVNNISLVVLYKHIIIYTIKGDMDVKNCTMICAKPLSPYLATWSVFNTGYIARYQLWYRNHYPGR